MNNSQPVPLRILHSACSPDDASPIIAQLEGDGRKAEYQRVDTEEAFLAALAQSPDLILFDLTPSPFDLENALRLLKERRPGIPLILIGEEDKDLAMTAFKHGADDYLTKGDFSRLRFALQNAMQKKQLRESEQRYRAIFENARVAIWDEDFSRLKLEIDKLRANGVDDFRSYLGDHPEFLQRAVQLVRILDANEATLRLYNISEKADVLGSLGDFVSPEAFQEELIAFAEGTAYFEREIQSQTMQGRLLNLLMTITYYEDPAGLSKALVHLTDITGRKVAEENTRSQNEYLSLLNEMTHAILASRDFDSTLYTLAENMANLIHADDCYIARWDEEKQIVIPVAATMSIEGLQPSYRDTRPEELKMALAVLDVRHALAADDIYDSPHINVDLAKQLRTRSALGIPLIAGEHKLGAAIIAFNTPHHFTPDEINRAEQAGNQVALALWTFQQSVEIQQRLRESTTLAKIERALSETERVGTGEVLRLIVDSARELMPHAEKSVIHLLEVEEQVLIAQAVSGYAEQEGESKRLRMRLGEGVAGKVIREGITINVADIQASPDFLVNDSPPEFRSLLVAPVQVSGQQIGTISLQSAVPHVFSPKDTELLNALAVQAAIAIENTRLFETTQQSLKEVNILYQISRGLAASLDADQLIRNVISLLQEIFGYYHVQIYLLDSRSGNLVVKHGSGYIGSELVQQGHFLSMGEGIVGHVAETGKAFATNNVEEVLFFQRNALLPQTQSELAVPIKIDQQITAVLDIQQLPGHRFTESDLRLMTAVADQLAVVLQKANLYSTLQTSLQQEQMVRSQLLQSERLALVGRLLASVSHELNNPLQAIQNALFLLKEEKDLSNQARQDLDIILSEAERMAALIERLRSAYRPVRIKDFQPVDLNSLIEDVYALITTYMRQKKIAFEFLPDPELPPVSGLPDQLRQVVLNLFLNAIEVMNPDGRLFVWTQYLPKQEEVLFTVRDSGPGIEAEILSHIFDAFITSKHTGTGLGLTITHDIIQQHHGRITANNDPQGGAVFSIWLPIHETGEA